MSYYIDPDQAFDGDQGASELQGKLSRAQWQDWKDRYKPYITKLSNLASDTGYADNQAQQSMDAVGQAFEQTADAQQMHDNGLGISRSARQQESSERQLSAAKKAEQVSSGNSTRTSAHDLQQHLLAGGMGLQNLPKGYR